MPRRTQHRVDDHGYQAGIKPGLGWQSREKSIGDSLGYGDDTHHQAGRQIVAEVLRLITLEHIQQRHV